MSLPPLETLERWSFGNTSDMVDELGALVLAGRKTATSSLLKFYEVENERLPQVGDFSIIEDGQGQPICVIETIEVTSQPFNQVDAAFAFDEGEGNRSLAYWREAHYRFFSEECRQLNLEFSESMKVVCERFRVIQRLSGFSSNLGGQA